MLENKYKAIETMLSTYLPHIVALIVGIGTAYINYKIGKLKTHVDSKTVITNAGDALRDDLLQIIDRYEKREASLLEKIETVNKSNQELQTTVNALREEITILRIDNRTLKAELQQTRRDLEAFDKKVYYKPDTTQTGDQ